MQPNLHEPPIYCRENRALCCCPRMDCSTSHEQASQRKSEGIQTTLPGHSLIHAGSEGGRRRGRKHAGPVSPGLCGLMQCGTSAPKGLLDRHQMRSGGEKRRDLPSIPGDSETVAKHAPCNSDTSGSRGGSRNQSGDDVARGSRSPDGSLETLVLISP